jgi:hypothetical protein
MQIGAAAAGVSGSKRRVEVGLRAHRDAGQFPPLVDEVEEGGDVGFAGRGDGDGCRRHTTRPVSSASSMRVRSLALVEGMSFCLQPAEMDGADPTMQIANRPTERPR